MTSRENDLLSLSKTLGSHLNWYRCCNFNFPFSLVSVSVEKIGVLVCIVCQTPKTTFNHISNTSNFAKYFPFCL